MLPAPLPPTLSATILIADDNPTNLAILSDALGEVGWDVLVATDGEETIAQAHYAHPDIIVLDVMMPPGIDGFETCRRLKQDPNTRGIPVLFATALTDTASKLRGFEVGGVDYVTKPIDRSEVVARVRTHLQLQQLQQQLQQQNEQLQLEIEQRRLAERQLQQANDRLLRLAAVDPLTQVANRRRFDEYLETCWRHLQRQGEPLSLILCDVDWFKSYNDTYGHPAGDRCLCQIAEALSDGFLRAADLVARYGGEEFAIILPNTEASGALEVAERLRMRIVNLALPHAHSAMGYVTLSLGVASEIPQVNHLADQLVEAADRALYQAKAAGRNQSIASSNAPPPDKLAEFSLPPAPGLPL